MKTKILYLFFFVLGISIGIAESTNKELNITDLNSRRDNPVTELVDYILSYNGQGRTFGIKRLQFMMMPMIFKMGVIMTLLVVLTAVSLKGLTVGIILLVLKLSSLFGKFYASFQSQKPTWTPPAPPVHFHVHNDPGYNHYDNGWEAPAADYYHKGQHPVHPIQHPPHGY
ncbi:uncharacterized protein LOC130664832 [Microplitis mediator]|uniref:uncharacterized protein LOC130664832 n=1 Tax=Microplitis mediator TaxID=375433 RepID=UPI0025571095|nr:uncharacterized protein LOC130664832 [Microplitis mediator]